MKLLILDFISRKRWIFILALVYTLICMPTGPNFIMAVLAVTFCQNNSAEWRRAVRSLPVSTRRLALTSWLMNIGLLPLVALTVVPLRIWIEGRVFTHGGFEDPGFIPVSCWWLVLGIFALGDVAWKTVLRAPFGPRTGRLAAISVGFVLYGMSATGALPVRLAGMNDWHWAVFAFVPVCVACSLLAAVMWPSLTLKATPTQEAGAAPSPSRRGPGLEGLGMLLARSHARAQRLVTLFLLPLLFVPWCVLKIHLGMPREAMSAEEIHSVTYSIVHWMPVLFALIFGSSWPYWWNLRSLRTLPLSSTGLAAVIFSVPLIGGAIVGLFMLVSGLLGLLAVRPEEACLDGMAAAAFGLLSLVVTLCNSGRVQAPIMAGILVFISASAGHAAGIVFGALWVHVMLAASYLLLISLSFLFILRGLHKSSMAYLPRLVPGSSEEMRVLG